jgi:hypothetical protein
VLKRLKSEKKTAAERNAKEKTTGKSAVLFLAAGAD